MKQLLFLLLFPCLAMAQYTGNAGQKITLGEQTTADGLVFRGVASIDTVTATSKITRANKQDTSAFLLLDTVTNLLWHYKTASNGWIQAGGGVSVSSFSAGTTGLTPSTATTGAVTLSGTLAVANGGTNRTTMPAGYILHGDGTSVDTSIGLFWNRTTTRLGIGTNNPLYTLQVNGDTRFNSSIFGSVLNTATNIGTSGFEDDYVLIGYDAWWGIKHTDNGSAHDFGIDVYNGGSPKNALTILNNGEVLMGYTTDQGTSILSVNGNVSANGSVLTSDKRFKENIKPLNKGLDIVIELKPVTFNYINDTDNNFSEFEEVGFIAQDVDKALSTESFVKSIVKYTDESNIDSKMVISPQNLIPILTKAIQEQQALIKALEQRILILENK